MPRTIYALLVGIDNYPPGVNSLAGCVNDIRRVEQLLQERVTGAGDEFKPLVLTDAAATRQGVIDAFRTHLAQAGSEDVALFYYSGHGSQQPSPPEFWHLEPDRLDETLVCYDSRSSAWDLADKELAQLIAEVAQNGPHLVVILDCCHSGSGTRDSNTSAESRDYVHIRRAPTDERARPLDSFIVSAEQASVLQPKLGVADWYSLPTGRHILLSACRAGEDAREILRDGIWYGALSYYLLDTLMHSGQVLSYRDLFNRVLARLRLRVSTQSPVLEASEIQDLNQPFLGGVIQPASSYFTLSFDAERQWIIDGGSVHGIAAPSDDETTRLTLFPFDKPLNQFHDDLSGAIGTARVTQVFPSFSIVQVEMAQGQTLDTETTYKAVVTGQPLPPLIVTFEGDDAGLALLRTALASTGPEGKPSLWVREGSYEESEYVVQAVDNRYRIQRKGDPYALIIDTVGLTESGARVARQRLEHIARWMLIGRLHNPNTDIAPDAVRLQIWVADDLDHWVLPSEDWNIRLEYRFSDGQWRQPQFKIKLTNQSDRRLYCVLFDLSETYGVFPILPEGGIWLDPGQEVWANHGEPLLASVPDSLWNAGVIEFRDTLKLIVSAQQFDATLLQQDDLPTAVGSSSGRRPGTR